MSGFVVWFTGLSGAGKSTLAAMLSAEVRARGVHVEVLDGDEVRTHLSKGLTFSREDRDTNVRRIGFVAKLVARSGACAMTAAISPYRAIRDEIRSTIPRFFEVYCECPVPALAERDPKGLYKKALAGEIKGFTGVDDPYEAPLRPEIVCRTDRESKEESLAKILGRLEELGLVPPRGGPLAHRGGALTPPHGGELTPRLVAPAERPALVERAATLPKLALARGALVALDGLGSGLLSPLRGFMNEKDHRRVLGDLRLENGLPWARPVLLEVSDEDAERATRAPELALTTQDGRLVAVLEVTDVHRPEGGARCVGGEVRVLERPLEASFRAWQRDPAVTRARLSELGHARVVGLRDPAPILRAHEHAAKWALAALDALLVDVALEGPAAGLPADARMRSLEAILARYFPEGRAFSSAHPGATEEMDVARRALDDAIALKNQGASHVLVSPAAAEALALHGAAELGVTPLVLEEVFHSTVTGELATERTAPGEASTRRTLSLEALCAAVRGAAEVPGELVRPEVGAILRDALR